MSKQFKTNTALKTSLRQSGGGPENNMRFTCTIVRITETRNNNHKVGWLSETKILPIYPIHPFTYKIMKTHSTRISKKSFTIKIPKCHLLLPPQLHLSDNILPKAKLPFNYYFQDYIYQQMSLRTVFFANLNYVQKLYQIEMWSQLPTLSATEDHVSLFAFQAFVLTGLFSPSVIEEKEEPTLTNYDEPSPSSDVPAIPPKNPKSKNPRVGFSKGGDKTQTNSKSSHIKPQTFPSIRRNQAPPPPPPRRYSPTTMTLPSECPTIR